MSQPGWWGRNWKWLVPVGCLTTLVLFAGLLALVVSLVLGMLKGSEPYSHALAIARANPEVIEALGSPITEGYFPSGNIEETGASGTAEFAIPISGPKGSATIYLDARKSMGRWQPIRLEVEFSATRRRIDLLQPTPATALPQAARA